MRYTVEEIEKRAFEATHLQHEGTTFPIVAATRAEEPHWLKIRLGNGTERTLSFVQLAEMDIELLVDSHSDKPPCPYCAAVAAIQYAIDINTTEGLEFLRLWNEGSFPEIREQWPDCPEEVFEGLE